MSKIMYEVTVDCDEADLPALYRMSGKYDPVEKVIIQTAFYSYELDPSRLRGLTINAKDQHDGR